MSRIPVYISPPRAAGPALSVGWLICLTAALGISVAAQDEAPHPDQFTSALFHFDSGNDLTEETGKGTRIVQGSTTTVEAEGRFAGALRIKPRKDTDTPASVTLPEAGREPTNFSIDFWFKLKSDGPFGRDMYLLSSGDCYFRYSVDRNALEFGVQPPTGWVGVATEKGKIMPAPDRWYHLAGTYDGSEVRLYVDGRLQGQAPARGELKQKGFILGACAWTKERASDLDGWIDELRFSTIARPDFDPANAPQPPKGERPVIAASARSPLHPFVLIPKTPTPPVLDGSPSGGTWEKAAWVGNPVYLNAKEISPKIDMRVGLLWDDSALYVGFKVSGFRKPVAITTTKGDDGLERDDAVEVCFKAPDFVQAKGQPVQFKLNCVGQRDDALGFDFGWNALWEGAVKTEGNNWSATFRIPFSNFGSSPKAGDQWEANFAAYLMGYNYRGFLWSPVGVGHHHQGDFGTIQFGGIDIPAHALGRFALDMSSLRVSGNLATPGNVRLLLLPESGGPAKQVMLGNVIANFDEEGRTAVAQTASRIDKGGEWLTTLEGVRPGDYLAKVLLADTGGRVLNVDVKPVKVSRSLEVRVLKYPVAGSAGLVVTVHDMGKPKALPAGLKVTLFDAKGAILREMNQSLAAKLPVEKRLSLDKLKNGESYKVVASTMSEDGNATVEDVAEFTLPERPPWADTDAGSLHGKVLKPWTPVRANGTALSCWGRTYDLGDALMPVAITSSGQRILHGGIRLVVSSGSQRVGIARAKGPVKVRLSRTGDVAEFESAADSSLCRLAMKGSLEFDGFMSFELRVKPKKKVEGLAVEIPLENSTARYLQPLPKAGNRDVAGAIPDSGVAMGPVNSLWICNYKAGLFFCCESTEGWTAPEGKAVEVVRRGKDTLVRLNLFQSPEGFDRERSYHFSLQATPVRPYNPDWQENGVRVANGLTFGQSAESLEEFKKSGGKTLIFFEHWCHVQNGGGSKREPELKKIVEECRRLGLKVILYFGFEIADAPEHKDMIDECKALVNQSANFYAPQQQNTYWVSYGGPYQEYLLHHFKRLKEAIGIDGVYLDGTLSLSASDNPAFGCGYVDEKGNRLPTVPLRRLREFAKRINNLFVQEGGVVFAHLGVVPPTMGFVSNTYLGEHVGFLNTDWQTIEDRIPADVARAVYTGRNTGVPMVLCFQNAWPHLRGVKPYWYKRGAAWADLHGVAINVLLESPMCPEGVEEMTKHRLLAEFGADRCEWIPCWETEKLVKCEPKGLKVSLYRRKDGAMVCAIANPSANQVSGFVDFTASEKLHIPDGAKSTELLSGKAVRLEAGKVYLDIPAFEHLLLRVE
ncbi:MAG: hypothetical protein HY318_19650 [Armatimonadetes bacterium]|nr:hypothetical protein [Armatimonadota bacterium]